MGEQDYEDPGLHSFGAAAELIFNAPDTESISFRVAHPAHLVDVVS